MSPFIVLDWQRWVDFKDGYNFAVESSSEQGHINWRHDTTLSPSDFVFGRSLRKRPSLTGEAFQGDKIFKSLTKKSTYDTDVEIILRVLSPSIRKVVLHVYKDHLVMVDMNHSQMNSHKLPGVLPNTTLIISDVLPTWTKFWNQNQTYKPWLSRRRPPS